MSTEGEAEIPIKPATDAFSSVGNIGILVAVGVVVLTLLFYVWKSWPNSSTQGKSSSFTPPPERAVYIETKAKRDISNLEHRDDLKKLLIKRALKTIPILLSLQNEGQSIERLYKKGMLTDDMHFKMKELKAFVDQEFQDVQHEANDLMEGWGEHVWQQAMQFHMMIQKQAESKNEERKASEEQKKLDAKPKTPKEKMKASSASSPAETSKSPTDKIIENKDSKRQDPPSEDDKEKQRGQSKKKSQRR